MAVDVHMLLFYGFNQRWARAALNSMQSFPLNAFFTENSNGHIGEARARAYKKGTAEFVSFLDYDDYLLPGFSTLIDAITADTTLAGVYGDSVIIDTEGAFVKKNLACRGLNSDTCNSQRLCINPLSIGALL